MTGARRLPVTQEFTPCAVRPLAFGNPLPRGFPNRETLADIGEALSNWFIEIEERGRSDKEEAKIREAPSAQTTSKALLLGAELRDSRVRIRNTDSRRTAAQ